MATPYIGEVRSVGFYFAPVGWALCNGQYLSISQNDVLYSLIGTTYGGDGQTTFALPNLQSRVAIHMGVGGGGVYTQGMASGAENVTLNANQLAGHSHAIAAQTAAGTQSTPANGFFAASTQPQFGPLAQGATSAPMLTQQGGGGAHSNIQPYQCINYIIALTGLYPNPS